MGIETTAGDGTPGGRDRGAVAPVPSRPDQRIERSRLAAIRDAVGAVAGAVLGLVPHVLHHIGLLAGAALITGATGNALFFVIGLGFSIPLLRRLYRRFRTWRAPAIAVAVFAGMFSLSAFVIGPAITGDSPADNPAPPAQTPTEDHTGHHPA
jgi:hypothetical protein